MSLVHRPTYLVHLRVKPAEVQALCEVTPEVQSNLKPCFILPPPSERDPELGRLFTAEEISRINPMRIVKHWGQKPCFLDVFHIIEKLGEKAIHEWLPSMHQTIFEHRGNATPVVPINANSQHIFAVKKICDSYGSSLAIRVPVEETELDGFERRIQAILNVCSVQARDATIFLDMSGIPLLNLSDAEGIATESLNKILDLDKWSKVSLAGSNYPERFPMDGDRQTCCIPRNDFLLWEIISKSLGHDANILPYADFGPDSSKIKFSNGRSVRAVQHIRYASYPHWVLSRSNSMQSVCRQISALPEFDGPNFSTADWYISECAKGNIKPGVSTDWRRISIVRHLTKTVSDLLKIEGKALPSIVADAPEDQFQMF